MLTNVHLVSYSQGDSKALLPHGIPKATTALSMMPRKILILLAIVTVERPEASWNPTIPSMTQIMSVWGTLGAVCKA